MIFEGGEQNSYVAVAMFCKASILNDNTYYNKKINYIYVCGFNMGTANIKRLCVR